MPQTSPSALHVSRDHGVIRVRIDNPPVNVLTIDLMGEISTLLTSLRDDQTATVIVFESANPDFFLAHVDMGLVDAISDGGVPAGEGDLTLFQAFGETLRHQPQVTVVKLRGTARGGGAEFVAAADMTFASREHGRLGQVESLMGLIPGGGGTQYALDRMGRNRALEIVLSGDSVDAATAERYGWINRAVPDAELDDFVGTLVSNIARLSPGVIAAAKAALPAQDLSDGMLRESRAGSTLVTLPAAEKLVRGGLAAGAQTREGELNLEDLMRGVTV